MFSCLHCYVQGLQRLQGTVVKKSLNASNYRVELLEALCCLLLVKTAAESGEGHGKCEGYCDNKGVVFHCAGSTKQSKMKPKQSQDDLVRLCKKLLKGMSIDVTYHHVKGHMHDILRKDHLSLEESLNVKAEHLMGWDGTRDEKVLAAFPQLGNTTSIGDVRLCLS